MGEAKRRIDLGLSPRKKKVEIATYYLNKLPYKTLSGKNYIFHRFIILPELNVKETLLKAFIAVS